MLSASFKKLKLNRFFFYFLLIFTISCLLSLFKLFQYKINVENDYRKDFPYEIYAEFLCHAKIGQ